MLITHYDILGVPENSTTDEIKGAYRCMALLHHPDRNQGSQDSSSMFLKVSEAYCVLSDADKRANYDKKIAEYRLRIKMQNQNAWQSVHQANKNAEREKARETFYKKENLWETSVSLLMAIGMFILGLALKLLPLGLIALCLFWCSRQDESGSTVHRNTVQLNTGSIPYESKYGTGRFDYNSLSSIEVNNGSMSDAIVILYNVNNGNVYRHAYIKESNNYTMEYIPEGVYDLKVYQGSGWNAVKKNGGGMPDGGFDYDESFSHSKSSDYFKIEFTETYEGISYSTYSVTLYKVKNGNMSTKRLSKSDFF